MHHLITTIIATGTWFRWSDAILDGMRILTGILIEKIPQDEIICVKKISFPIFFNIIFKLFFFSCSFQVERFYLGISLWFFYLHSLKCKEIVNAEERIWLYFGDFVYIFNFRDLFITVTPLLLILPWDVWGFYIKVNIVATIPTVCFNSREFFGGLMILCGLCSLSNLSKPS